MARCGGEAGCTGGAGSDGGAGAHPGGEFAMAVTVTGGMRPLVPLCRGGGAARVAAYSQKRLDGGLPRSEPLPSAKSQPALAVEGEPLVSPRSFHPVLRQQN